MQAAKDPWDSPSNFDFLEAWGMLSPEEREDIPATFREKCENRVTVLLATIGKNGHNGHDILPASEFAQVKSARHIMSTDMGPARYCVEGRVPSGLVIIGGRPKAKKSWYALQLGIAKSMGGRFMHMTTSQCRVLYLALEDNDRRMKQRLEFFGLTPDKAPENLHLVYEWPVGLEGIEKLNRWMTQFPDTRLIIVDVLQRFRGPTDKRASAYDSDYQTMALLHGITQRHPDLTVLVVHHVKKGAVDDPVEALNGTFAIAGGADAYIILRKGSENQWIAHIDGRDWAQWDHEFNWEFIAQEGWRQMGLADGATLTEHQNNVVKWAKEEGFLTPTKLSEKRAISKSTAHEALQSCVDKGALRVWAGRVLPERPERMT